MEIAGKEHKIQWVRPHQIMRVFIFMTHVLRQGVVTPIRPVLTSATAVKNFDRPKSGLDR